MQKKLFIVIALFAPALVMPGFIHAATLNITTDKNSVSIGEPVSIHVALDTQGDDVNTVRLEILIPPQLFQVAAINSGGSIVSFWIAPPETSSSGMIDLAGIIPGGYRGPSGFLTSFTLVPIGSGAGNIEIATATVLANDGLGTPLAVAFHGATIPIASSTYAGSSAAENYSTVAPELFTPVIASDPDLFNGSYFLAFSTVDKGSGIDHYEVLEMPTSPSSRTAPSWQVAVSPYLLKDQSLSSNVYVRAVSHAGTFLVVELPARYPYNAAVMRLRVEWLVCPILILILGLCITFFVLRIKRRRRVS